jgi:hypothetical protein
MANSKQLTLIVGILTFSVILVYFMTGFKKSMEPSLMKESSRVGVLPTTQSHSSNYDYSDPMAADVPSGLWGGYGTRILSQAGHSWTDSDVARSRGGVAQFGKLAPRHKNVLPASSGDAAYSHESGGGATTSRYNWVS